MQLLLCIACSPLLYIFVSSISLLDYMVYHIKMVDANAYFEHISLVKYPILHMTDRDKTVPNLTTSEENRPRISSEFY